MSHKISFTVVMCFYAQDNVQFLEAALKSISVEQILKPNEIVIVQNGEVSLEHCSVIESQEIICKSLLIDFKWIRIEQNMGLAYGLNLAIQNSSHSYVARMDADDISLPFRFSKQIMEIEQNNYDILGTSITIIDNSDYQSTCFHYPSNTQDCKNFLPKGSPFAHPSIIIRKQLLLEFPYHHSPNNTKIGNEDIELWFRIFKNRDVKVANLEIPLLLFRVNNAFYNRRSYSKALEEFKIYWAGTFHLFGYSSKLIYPLFRLTTRFLPNWGKKIAYSYRNAILYKWGSSKQ